MDRGNDSDVHDGADGDPGRSGVHYVVLLNSNPAPFAPQAVWASAAWIGGTLVFFSTVQGMAAQFLGANPQVTAGLAIDPTKIPPVVAQNPDTLVPYYFNLIAESTPGWSGCWRFARWRPCNRPAPHTCQRRGILTRDLYKRYLNPSATHITQKLFGRLGITFIVICALLVATYSRDALVLLGGLAVAFGFQMWVPLLSVCYVRGSPALARQPGSPLD